VFLRASVYWLSAFVGLFLNHNAQLLPHPKNNVWHMYPKVFPSSNSCGFKIIKVGRGERTGRYFPKGRNILWGHLKITDCYKYCITDPKTVVQFCESTAGFTVKWHVRKKRRNSILMPSDYPDLGSASDLLKQISHTVRPIRSITQMDNEASSVWNFCTNFLDVFSRGNQWWHREMSAVFSS